MGKICFSIFVFYSIFLSGIAQTININSITFMRQPSGDGGYTLDGMRMTGSRAKLLNSNNFGATGIYPKSISIYDGFGASGSLMLDTTSLMDIFFFGAFNKADVSMQQFTNAEIDSLYDWSKRGGKLIIAAEPSQIPSYNLAMLDQKWGFHLINENPNAIIPTTQGNSTEIFNGPFGIVYAAYQGGALQGYFDIVPENSEIYATNGFDQPALFIDCNTLDLIIADVDGYTDLGGVTAWGNVNSSNDIFWANTIVFMDNLQNPPFITNNGSNLSCTNIYSNYQWYMNGELITDAINQSYNVSQNGSYSVEATLDCGCKLFSNIITIDIFPEEDSLSIPNAFTPNGNGVNDIFIVHGQNIKTIQGIIFNRWGQQLYEWNNINDGWNGKTVQENEVSEGVYFYVVTVLYKDGFVETMSGAIELIR